MPVSLADPLGLIPGCIPVAKRSAPDKDNESADDSKGHGPSTTEDADAGLPEPQGDCANAVGSGGGGGIFLDGVDVTGIGGLLGNGESNNVVPGTGSGGWIPDGQGGYYNPGNDCYTNRGSIRCSAEGFAETYGQQDQEPDLGPPSWMANPPAPLGGSMNGPAPPHDPIGSALKKLLDALNNDPDCLAFLSSKGISAAEMLNAIYQYGSYGPATQAPRKTAEGWSMMNGVSNANNRAITINSVGGFFNSTYTSQATGTLILDTDRKRIAGGTVRAQEFILLHELGHNTDVLRPDKDNQALIDANDKDLETHCKKTINSFPK